MNPGLVQPIRRGRSLFVSVVVEACRYPLKNQPVPHETVSAERQRFVLGLAWGSADAVGQAVVELDPIENRAAGLFANI